MDWNFLPPLQLIALPYFILLLGDYLLVWSPDERENREKQLRKTNKTYDHPPVTQLRPPRAYRYSAQEHVLHAGQLERRTFDRDRDR